MSTDALVFADGNSVPYTPSCEHLRINKTDPSKALNGFGSLDVFFECVSALSLVKEFVRNQPHM